MISRGEHPHTVPDYGHGCKPAEEPRGTWTGRKVVPNNENAHAHQDGEANRVGVAGAGVGVGVRRQGQERRGGRAAACRAHRDGPDQITAVKGPDGVHLETFDVAELFEHAGKALADKRFDDAITSYELLLKEFPGDTKYRLPSLYNEGLAYQAKKDWAKAAETFKKMQALAPDSSDTKDALFQLGATYAEMGNWPTSATIFAELLERKDMNADDKIEAYARRGFAQFQLKDLDTAERTFSTALYYLPQHREGGAAADRLLSRPR